MSPTGGCENLTVDFWPGAAGLTQGSQEREDTLIWQVVPWPWTALTRPRRELAMETPKTDPSIGEVICRSQPTHCNSRARKDREGREGKVQNCCTESRWESPAAPISTRSSSAQVKNTLWWPRQCSQVFSSLLDFKFPMFSHLWKWFFFVSHPKFLFLQCITKDWIQEGSAHLWSQHLGDRGRRIQSSMPPLAT